jgi:RNA polymerase-binding transcription factor DksA
VSKKTAPAKTENKAEAKKPVKVEKKAAPKTTKKTPAPAPKAKKAAPTKTENKAEAKKPVKVEKKASKASSKPAAPAPKAKKSATKATASKTKKAEPKPEAPKPVADQVSAPKKPGIPPVVAQLVAQLKKDKEWQKFVKTQRQHLLDLRDRILDAGHSAKEILKAHPEGSEASGSGEHQGDAGSSAYDRDFALEMISKDQDALAEIEAALKRIDDGTYGICQMSFKLIPKLRLEAIPHARLSVECQSQWEKEKGRAVKFRGKDAIGFMAGAQNDSELTVSLDEDEE